jgi:hypothetical protein
MDQLLKNGFASSTIQPLCWLTPWGYESQS